jgi:Ca-activated chloride channel family protein
LGAFAQTIPQNASGSSQDAAQVAKQGSEASAPTLPAATTQGNGTSAANTGATQPAPTTPAQPAPPAGSVAAAGNAAQPAAMASKSKLPSEADYNEVHVAPMVKSEDKVKFDPASPDAIEAGLKTHTKPIRVDVDLVLVPVTVTDTMNRLVTGLEKDNFILLDNGQKQTIQHFSSEDAPISLGIIFDMSGSMSNKIGKSREAVSEFLKTANPEDEFFLIAFNERPMLIADFTSKVDDVESQLVGTQPRGRTALLDSIYLGITKMRQAHQQRKALLIISDGGDNRSRYTENEIKSLVREADVQIFAIGIFDSAPRTDEERSGPELLADVTGVTGGRTFTVDRPNEMSDAATKIGLELRNQYVLGYRPTKPARNGKWRKVKVKLSAPKGLPPLSVYAKTGYYAPTQ